MLEPIKMKPNTTSFKGLNSLQDPLNARKSYEQIRKDNEGILALEGEKIKKHGAQSGNTINLVG